MPDPTEVNTMFARIAHRYDLANRLLSGGADVRWRRRLVTAVRRARPRVVLDLATGSGDVAFALDRGLPANVQIIGMDFCQPMLDKAEAKKRKAGGSANLWFLQGDGMALPLADASVDVVTIAFGLRNMADRTGALREMRRVLHASHGRLFVLEFSQPHPWFRPFYYFYLKRVLPRFAGLITGDRAAYEYLGDSIDQFPDRARLTDELRAVGFPTVTATALTLGIVALHEAAV
ncbi:MAG: bifunctional demethylmenaquinone methyltransferase/2-methoxy-6-polyprenyl-1,4-benzoquinol methylase UbiE [Opitutaceae bacterium]|jgi:demethylmenaquinone methyltransferase/2-methoxy-6-polyprenyl-1,4-benzoquinol methylase